MLIKELNRLLVEARKPDVTYTSKEVKGKVDKVIVKLEGSKSGSFTTLSKNYKELQTQINELTEKLDLRKAELKNKMEDYFDAEDAVLTRVMETCSLTMTMSKGQPAGVKVDYEVAYNTLVSQLAEMVPELTSKVKLLADAATKAAEKPSAGRASALTIKVNEGVMDYVRGLVAKVMKWTQKFDSKLAKLKADFEAHMKG